MLLKKYALIACSVVGVIVLLLWLSGTFSTKISMKTVPPEPRNINGMIVNVRLAKLPLLESATGSIQAVHETTISSKLPARVTEMNIKAGQTVNKGEVLLRLDDAELQAKLQKAKSNVVMAEAAHAQAVLDERRFATLLMSQATSRQLYENAATRLKSADAELRMVREAVKEVQSLLDYTVIAAPMDGIVIDKKVDVGDTVMPGQILLKLYDQKQMQIVASVRESLTFKLKVGQNIGVRVDALNRLCSGTVSEIVPESNSASRTFLVKVTGPCPAGIYTGMFGRILIPLENEEVLLIPCRAIRNVGQLELVDVAVAGHAVRRSVRAGRKFGEEIEVLSGLRQNEQVIVAESDSLHKDTDNGK
jgi:RND family efflux transporter MFP subunit